MRVPGRPVLRPPVPPPTVPRVMVIGLDGATFDVLVPLAEAGVMPNMARLLATSSLSVLSSTRPAITPVAWTTFQTGCEPHGHGIFDYRYLDHRRGRLQLNSTARIACGTLLESVSEAGGEVVSLQLPMTWPPRSIRGVVLGGLDSPSSEAALAPFPEFAARLQAAGFRYDLTTAWRRKPNGTLEVAEGVRRSETSFRCQAAGAGVADGMTDWRLMIVQFQQLDSLQHRCWHLLGVDPTMPADLPGTGLVRQALSTLDACVGELVELAQRRGAAIVLLSDHGFGPFRSSIHVPWLLASRGLLKLPGWFGRASYAAHRGAWRLRKFAFRRLNTGASTAGMSRSLSALLPIDWRRSLALTLHGSLGGLVYLNTPTRFGVGPVRTARLQSQVLADTAGAFQEARHPESGEPLFDEVFGTAERFNVDPAPRMWPDLIAIPAPGFHTRHKFDQTSGLLRDDPEMTGTHREEGVLLIQAPGVVTGRHGTAHLRDVAPTILNLLGLPAPPTMTGRVLKEVLEPSAPAVPISRVAGPTPERQAEMREADEALVESRLRELGYVD